MPCSTRLVHSFTMSAKATLEPRGRTRHVSCVAHWRMVSYILPIRTTHPLSGDVDRYLAWLSARVELIVVDGSAPSVFERHARRWAALPLGHEHIDGDVVRLLNGKVAGVLTGLRR